MKTNTTVASKLKGKKILIATLGVDGHVNPLTGLAKYLQEQGCEVGWYTATKYANKLKELGIRHFPFVKATNYNHPGEAWPEMLKMTDMIERLNYGFIHIIVNEAAKFCADIEELSKDFPFELVVADSLFPAIPLIRYHLKKPVVCIGVFPLPLAGDGLAPYGMAMPPAVNEEQRAQYAQMQKHSTEVDFRPSIAAFEKVLEGYRLDLPDKAEQMFDILVTHSNVYLQVGVPSFEYQRKNLSDHIRFIGALYPYSTNKQGKGWHDARLDKYKQVILVTQGTIEGDIEKLFVPALEAFKGTDVLVVATTGGSRTGELRSRFPYDNIIIEDFIPFGDVMPHADVYVTNGGYGGVLLSISHRLPIVAAGLLEHKNEICARIGYFGLGIDLKTETPAKEQIREAVDKVLADGSYRKNIARLAEEIGTYGANELCAAEIARLL